MESPTRLYLIRHGEVEERYHRVFGGRIDMDLSPLGSEQAAAVAHMGAHALGAAGYSYKASALAAGCDDHAVTQSEACRQVAAMNDAVARAVSSLPPLGESRSGPLEPGRLSSGHVGETIRAIQAQLRAR